MPYKFGSLRGVFGSLRDDTFQEHRYADAYEIETRGHEQRLAISAAGRHDVLLLACSQLLTAPFYLLYVLNTSRRDHERGRYQSPLLERAEMETFVATFKDALAHDARHDIWIHSPQDEATLVWDQNNLIYAYGSIRHFIPVLEAHGLRAGSVVIPAPHSYHYHDEYDEAEDAAVAYFDWIVSPLQSEDT